MQLAEAVPQPVVNEVVEQTLRASTRRKNR